MKKLLIGLAAILAVGSGASTASAQDAASITLVHGIPGTTVDLIVNGSVAIDGFVPGSLADISSFAGERLTGVEVRDDATGAVLIGPIATLDVPATGNWSYVAHLDAAGTPSITPFENNTNPTATAGEARLTVRHAAEAPAIDIIVGDLGVIARAGPQQERQECRQEGGQQLHRVVEGHTDLKLRQSWQEV